MSTFDIEWLRKSDNVSVTLVEDAVESVRRLASDAEAAHDAEDDLHREVLRAIAEGRLAIGTSAVEVSAAALRTSEIKFERWCA